MYCSIIEFSIKLLETDNMNNSNYILNMIYEKKKYKLDYKYKCEWRGGFLSRGIFHSGDFVGNPIFLHLFRLGVMAEILRRVYINGKKWLDKFLKIKLLFHQTYESMVWFFSLEKCWQIGNNRICSRNKWCLNIPNWEEHVGSWIKVNYWTETNGRLVQLPIIWTQNWKKVKIGEYPLKPHAGEFSKIWKKFLRKLKQALF